MMNDEFLHRLRKDPRPEFAARLQARLRRQPPLPPRAPSLLRNLITVLFLGGAAFAVTSMVINGLPDSLLKWYQHSASRTAAQHVPAPAYGARRYGSLAMRPWSSPELSPLQWNTPGGATPLTRSANGTAPATSPPSAAAAGGATPKVSSRIVGVPPGLQKAQLTLAASWAAYPYAAPLVESANRTWSWETANRDWSAASHAGGPHINVSVKDSGLWLESMCEGGASAPDLAFTFEAVGTVPNPPCPRSASGHPRSIIAVPAGYEAVALARSPLYGAVDVTRREIFLALAKWVPDPRGAAVHENPNTTWRQIDAALGAEPAEPIAFLGPPLSSAAGHSMVDLLVEAGCQTFPWIAALKSTDPDRYARICRTVRTDGVYVEVSSLAPSRLLSEPNAVGILGFQNLTYTPFKDLAVGTLDGVQPTLQGIESGAYPGSRALYLYVNRDRAPAIVVVNLLRDAGWLGTRPDSALVPLSDSEVQSAFEALGR